MRLEFTYTFADLQETLTAPQNAAQRAARKRRRIINLICWPVTVLGFGLVAWAGRSSPRWPWVLDGMPLDMVTDVLPGMLAAAFVCLFVFLASWGAWRASRARRPDPAANTRNPVVQIIGMVFALLIAGGTVLLTQKDAVLLWMPTRSERILASGGPGLAMIFLLIAMATLHRRWSIRKQWVSKPGWLRPTTIEMDAQGFRVWDAISRYEFSWPYFVRARETAHLLVLSGEGEVQHIIPKRAFADLAEIERCRALLQSMIGKVEFQVTPTGFEVLPQRVLSLPALELPAAQDAGAERIGQTSQT
jgi:hypothetical protein